MTEPPTSPVPPSCRREALLTLAAAAVVVLFAASFLLLDRGTFWIDDYQTANLPACCEIARAWREGEFPLLSRSSWRGGALAGEYSAGVFSPSLTLASLLVFGLDLPLPLAAASIVLIHLGILAAGAFRLARRQGLAVDLALLVAVLGSVSGWIFVWGARAWLPCLISFAWLPWYWWALEQIRLGHRGPASFVPPALFLFLVVGAGWPFTVVMAAVVSLVMLLRTWAEQGVRATWPVFAAGITGLALSAPAWLMLLEYASSTLRGQSVGPRLSFCWLVPLTSLPGLVLPQFVSPWFVFGDRLPHMALELTGGLVPVAVLAAALARGRRQLFHALRWEWGLFLLTFVLCVCPSVGPLQYSFRWLPFFSLALVLLAAHALAWLRTQPAVAVEGGRPSLTPGAWAAGLVLLVWLVALARRADPTPTTFWAGLCTLLATGLWALIEARSARGTLLRTWAPCGVALLSCWFAYAGCTPFCEVATWQIPEAIRRPEPLDPARRYISFFAQDDIIAWEQEIRMTDRVWGTGSALYPGNTPSYAGLDFVNGYSPTGPAGLDRLFAFHCHGDCSPERAEQILATETGPDGLLQLMAVDGLIVSDRCSGSLSVLEAQGWSKVARIEGGTVWHRHGNLGTHVRSLSQAEVLGSRAEIEQRLLSREQGPVPLLLLGQKGAPVAGMQRFTVADVHLLSEGRNAVTVEVSGPAEGEVLVAFARLWQSGYRATCNGQPVPVELLDLTMPAVRLPAGLRGQVVLEYRPRSLVYGCWLAGVAGGGCLLALALAGLRSLRERKRRPAPRESVWKTPERPSGSAQEMQAVGLREERS